MTGMRAAMTLIEVMVVVAILALLAATLTFGLSGKLGRARHEIAKTQIGQIVGQVQLFQLEKRTLPSVGDGLAVLTTAPNASWYLEVEKLTDPWGHVYLYLAPGPAGHAFEIVTYGADGQIGGTGEAADISSASLGKTNP